MRTRSLALTLLLLLSAALCAQVKPATRSPQYEAVQQRLAKGWNAWNARNVLSHALLPEGLAIDVEIDLGTVVGDSSLDRAMIGHSTTGKATPGAHTFGPGYNELTIEYRGLKFKVEGAITGNDLVLLVTPIAKQDDRSSPVAIFHAGMLWNRPGAVSHEDDHMRATIPGRDAIDIFVTGTPIANSMVPVSGPYLALPMDTPVALSTGRRRTLDEAQSIVRQQRAAYEQAIAAHGKSAELADAIETVLGWDTIFEPEHNRVVTPVSRGWWNELFGGYVLFEWDTYFAAYLAALDNKDLAYANAIEITKSITPSGLVPNFARALGHDSYDRSESPVGAITALAIYRKYKESWFLAEIYDELLRWNRWREANRDIDGYIVLGSTPFNTPWAGSDPSVDTLQGAKFEGLDNSPMYDNAPYDTKRHLMQLADVGTMSLFVADCDALAEIATILHHDGDVRELRARQKKYGDKLQSLWDEKSGQFLNRNLVTGELSPRTSPTNFYPLLARVATKQQAERMVREHLLNPKEFWGKFVIPSTPRNDPAFADNDYWRGRIWGPMNFLVYLGLRNYDFPDVRAEFAEKSATLFRGEWIAKHHVHENYDANTGEGDTISGSDPFYHWGALLMLTEAMERGEF